jgi:hypothetical protein
VPEPKRRLPRPPTDLDVTVDGLDAVYRRHAAWLVAFLARRFGREVAEDLAQETFLKLAKSPGPRSTRARTTYAASQPSADPASSRSPS